MCKDEKTLVLASASPRRAALLKEADVRFEIVPADIDEAAIRADSAEETVKKIALEKAKRIYGERGGFVLGADSAVIFRGEILGKPKDPADAKRMLKLLNGNVHEVKTGVAFIAEGRVYNECVTTAVRFETLGEEFIDAYIASGSPLDKAGAYGIQDGGLVKSIDGSYSNVVGLPMERVTALLRLEGFLKE